MKFSDLKFAPRLLRKEDAELYVGGRGNLETLCKKLGLKPLVQHSRNTSYDIRDLDAAIDRAKIKGWPKASDQ